MQVYLYMHIVVHVWFSVSEQSVTVFTSNWSISEDVWTIRELEHWLRLRNEFEFVESWCFQAGCFFTKRANFSAVAFRAAHRDLPTSTAPAQHRTQHRGRAIRFGPGPKGQQNDPGQVGQPGTCGRGLPERLPVRLGAARRRKP